jgi:hypothetical protein
VTALNAVDRRLVIALSALFVAVFFAMLTNMLASRRIEESLGRRRITGLRGPGQPGTGLTGRDQLGARWDRTPVVLRMFDPQLARSVRHNSGFRNVRATAALATPWFAGAAPAWTC